MSKCLALFGSPVNIGAGEMNMRNSKAPVLRNESAQAVLVLRIRTILRADLVLTEHVGVHRHVL
jgi:hypothetical protein